MACYRENEIRGRGGHVGQCWEGGRSCNNKRRGMVDLCGEKCCGFCSVRSAIHAVTGGEAGSPLPHPGGTSRGQSAVRPFLCPRGFSQSQSPPKHAQNRFTLQKGVLAPHAQFSTSTATAHIYCPAVQADPWQGNGEGCFLSPGPGAQRCCLSQVGNGAAQCNEK